MALLNVPPKEHVRVKPETLRSFTCGLFAKAGMAEDQAQFLAELLVASDLRGVHSHGTYQAPGYLAQLRNGELNLRPRVGIVQETETSAVLDGDGGLGYFPAFRAAHMAVEKAKRHGVGVATTRNHGHYGAAGHYSRIASAADCIGISISAVQFMPSPDSFVWGAGGCPPISIAIPSGGGPSLVPDMGLYVNLRDWQTFPEVFDKAPEVFLKMLGLASVCNVLGGILAGIHGERPAGARRFAGANQGSFIAAIEVERLLPPEEFKLHVDRYVAAARGMKPLPGFDRAELPGTLEWQREQEYAKSGIPIGPGHLAALNEAAKPFGMAPLRV